MREPELKVEHFGPVAVATLCRPDRLNSIGEQLREELPAAWEELDRDRSVRALVITGEGNRAFCTGMDLREVAAAGALRRLEADVEKAFQLTPLSCGSWLPTVIAINGVCAGAGLHFIADGDIVIAVDHATFVDTHVTVGQVTALEPISLLHRIGMGNVLRLALLGRDGRIGAQEALRMSLVDEVVTEDRLLERALEVGHAIARGSPAAVEASKRAIRESLNLNYRDALQHGWELLVAHRSTPDAMEGPMAFVEKRDPQWSERR